MGIDDRDYMRERRRGEARLGSATWIDAKARVEHHGFWFDAANRGHGYRKDRWRRSGTVPHPAQKWFFFLSALAILVPMYGPAKREGWLPDLAAGRPFPASGSVTVARDLASDHVTSSLEVQTSEANAVVQLFDRANRRHVLSVYVAGSDRVRVPAPRGTFELRLIEGRKWHGSERWFGPNTSYETVSKPMMFEAGVGHIIDLRRRPNGNLHTRLILSKPEPL